MTHEVRVAGGKRPRIASLDIARGIMLVASVGTDSLVRAPWWATHAAWDGVTPLDVIFPIFVTLTGCGIAFAYAKGIQSPWRLVRRVVVLLVVGLLYNAVTTGAWDLETWRTFGVLQLNAVVILVVSLLHIVARSVRAWGIIVLVGTVLLVLLHAAIALRCGVVTPECNPSLSIDLRVMPIEHTYHQGTAGHDPEGFVAIAGATLQASIGAMFGHLILRARDAGWRAPRLVGAGMALSATVAVLAVAAVLAPVAFGAEPTLIMKRLWTPPFALLVGAGVGVVLTLLYATIDRGTDEARVRRLRPLEPLLALGRNSLLVYFGSHVVNALLHRAPWFSAYVEASSSWVEGLAALLAIGMILGWTAIAVVLNRARIYIRA